MDVWQGLQCHLQNLIKILKIFKKTSATKICLSHHWRIKKYEMILENEDLVFIQRKLTR